MNYSETLQYLFQKLPVFNRIGAAAYKADLTNTITLCQYLGNPQKAFKSIHIGGTNGKGSCSHMLASVFQHAGYKTGLYTSPHLFDFRERIKINGQEVEQDWIVNSVEHLIPVIEAIQPSFFEVTVALAFAYFAAQHVDIAVIEVGLGGLLDSTNVILPEISLITNISFDHTNLLGNHLHEIAVQKAGIIKHGIPVVIGETHRDSEMVFIRKAAEQQAPIIFADQWYNVEILEENQTLQRIQLIDQQHRIQLYELDLIGHYQIHNVQSVCAVLQLMRDAGWQIDQHAVQSGLASVKQSTGLRGRFDVLSKSPLIIADVAHNEAGIREVLRQIDNVPYNNLHIITGFVQDKDVHTILSLLPKTASYYFCQADIPRAMPWQLLTSSAQELGLNGTGYPSVYKALDVARSKATTDDVLLICGSFFIMEDVYSYFEKKKETL
jgi:dihydrofolate synthase / folylpolyglutamate synthase